MGVPGFFRWLCQRYPLILRKFEDPSRPSVNNLYIDTNGIIHSAASATKFKGPELTNDFLSELYRRIDSCVQIYQPTDLIFISSDGVAPYAKACQQRQRRFVSAQESDSEAIDHCAITPGTQLMYDIHQKLKEFIKKQKKTDSSWSKPRVIYSGVFVPGEGEHKIINFIRESRTSPDYNPSLVHCIPAGDADLYFLALQTHEINIILTVGLDSSYVRRGAPKYEAKGSCISWGEENVGLVYVSLIREYISIDFGVEKGEELEKTIDDFIALSFLIGNDFIPYIKDVDIKESYDDIIDIYKAMKKKKGHLVENGQFNKPILIDFLERVVYLQRLRFKEKMNLNLPIEKVADLYTENNRNYLSEKFKVTSENDLNQLIEKMANSLLDAFDWVLRYYREGCPSWRWHYPYHYGPPLEFVIPFIEDHEFVVETENDFPNPPLLLLLSVIPPQSKDLLPEVLRPLVDCDELKAFFPYTFERDLNGRKFDWLATILVPMIDIDLLEKKFNEVEIPDEINEKLNKLEFPLELNDSGEFEEISISKGEPFLSVCFSKEKVPCIPSFDNFRFHAEVRVVPVKVFYRFSDKPSVVINIQRDHMKASNFLNFLNQTVLVNWPYLRPAKVVGMMDKEVVYDPQKKLFIQNSMETFFPDEMCNKEHLTKEALDLGSISVFLTVSLQNRDGSFDTKVTTNVPINLAVPLNFCPETVQNFQPPLLRDQPETTEKVVFVDGLFENCVGEIIDKKGEFFKVNVHRRSNFPIYKELPSKWVTFDDLLKTVGHISFKALRQCLSKVFVDPFGVNIAFTLMTYDRRVLFGCCKYLQNERDYVFASFIPALVVEYFSYTGNLKTIIMDSISRKERYPSKITLEMLYGGTVEHQNECFKRLTNWLSEKAPAVKFPLVPEDNDFLSVESLLELEQRVVNFGFSEKIELADNIKNSEIFWRMKSCQIKSDALPSIGQRVVSIASSGPALFGEIGTVIETVPTANSVMVLFDNELACGTRLNEILSTNRALRVKVQDIIVLNQ